MGDVEATLDNILIVSRGALATQRLVTALKGMASKPNRGVGKPTRWCIGEI